MAFGFGGLGKSLGLRRGNSSGLFGELAKRAIPMFGQGTKPMMGNAGGTASPSPAMGGAVEPIAQSPGGGLGSFTEPSAPGNIGIVGGILKGRSPEEAFGGGFQRLPNAPGEPGDLGKTAPSMIGTGIGNFGNFGGNATASRPGMMYPWGSPMMGGMRGGPQFGTSDPGGIGSAAYDPFGAGADRENLIARFMRQINDPNMARMLSRGR